MTKFLIVVVPLLVLVFDLKDKFPVRIILVGLSLVSVHLDRNRGKTANWMRRENGTAFPTGILVDPIIRSQADLYTRAEKFDVFFRQLNQLLHHSTHFTSNAVTAFDPGE
jgi:hypothetical protein